MSRPRGGYIGFNRVPAASAVNSEASGVWTLREAEALKRAGTWPIAFVSPTQISGLQLWLDAADSATLFDATTGGSLVAANGNIGRWEDKSGNQRHAIQSTSQQRPVRNLTGSTAGKSAVSFTAASSHILTSSDPLTSSSNFTICLHGSVAFSRGRDGQGDGWSIGRGGVVLTSDGPALFQHSPAAGAATYLRSYIFRLEQGVALSSYANGTISATSVNKTELRTSTVGLDIGGQNSSYTSGFMSEIFIYNKLLTSSEMAAVENYLNTKWA